MHVVVVQRLVVVESVLVEHADGGKRRDEFFGLVDNGSSPDAPPCSLSLELVELST